MASWLLIDGYNLAFRSFYGVPELTRSDGFPTNVLHGWLRTLWYLENEFQPKNVVVFFDYGRSKRRLEMHPEYKANRSETPDALVQQMPYVNELTRELGYPVIQEEGIEADDLLATVAHQLDQKGEDVCIVSSDKDFAQMIRGRVTQLVPPPTANPKLGWRKLDGAGVEEKFGVKPEAIVDYLALIGDTSDNIPGIQGVGPKTACKWIQEWGSIDNLLKHVDEVKPERFRAVLMESSELLKKNVDLIQLQKDLDVQENLTKRVPEREKLFEFLGKMEMKTALKEAQKRYTDQVTFLF
jgi:DNA polymerase-1